jgi:uncharacterized protein involved in exopolysaccharide biosynthesis
VVQQNLDFTGALRRHWPVALLVFIAALVATAIVTARQEPVYEASAQLVVAPAGAQSTADVIRGLETLERRTVVATFARIPSTPEVHREVAVAMKLDESRRYGAHGSVVPNTNVIRIDAEGPDAEKTAMFANLVATATARHAEALYRVYSLRVLAAARRPGRPAFPDKRRNYLVGGALGIFAGIVSVLAMARLRGSPS